MDPELLALKWNNHQKTFFHVLSELRSNELFTDATLTCDSKFFPIHKIVLASCSDYFREIFQRTSCKSPVIVLKDIRHQDLAVLLDYMYLGEVEVRQTDLTRLIEVAECLQVKGLTASDENTPKSSKKRSSSSPVSSEIKNKRLKSTFSGQGNCAIDKSLFNQEDKISDSVFENELEANSLPIMNIKMENEVSKCESDFGSENQEDFGDEVADDIKQKAVFHNLQEADKEEFDESIAGPSSVKDGSDLWDNVESSNSMPSSFLQAQSKENTDGDFTVKEEDFIKHSRKSYECRICSNTFTQKGNLKRHLRLHAGIKPYSCEFCGHRSNTKGDLDYHILTHTGERPFACDYCPYKATQRYNLKRHIAANHIGK